MYINCILMMRHLLVGFHFTLYSSQFIPDPASAFTVGQVVQCRVLECDPTNKRLALTLKVF